MKVAAEKAAKSAYCPYSNFPVGAAVLTDKFEIYSGCNVENASLGLTICAERNAIFQSIAKGAQRIIGVVIVTPTADPTPPCGACRQVLKEFADTVEIFSFGKDGKKQKYSLDELLPFTFKLNKPDLK